MWPFRSKPDAEQRAASWSPDPGAHYDFARGDVVYGTNWQQENQSGVSVTQTTAMQLPAVYRCVTLNSETPASLPVSCFVKTDTGRDPRPSPVWIAQPNPEQTWPEFVQQVQASLELRPRLFRVRLRDPDRGRARVAARVRLHKAGHGQARRRLAVQGYASVHGW